MKLYSYASLAAIILTANTYAAERMNLHHQPVSILANFSKALSLKEINRNIDFKKTLHIRAQQYFNNYPILRSGIVLHVVSVDSKIDFSKVLNSNQANLDGHLYKNIEKDLGAAPANVPANLIQDVATTLELNTNYINNIKTQLVVVINSNNKAVWAYKLNFMEKQQALEYQVVVDANTHLIYKTAKRKIFKKPLMKKIPQAGMFEEVKAGGIGGNEKTGMIYYDDGVGPNHAPAFTVERNSLNKICYLQTKDIVLRDWNTDLDVVQFPCEKPDANHNGLYWNNKIDITNGAYNPANDIFFAATMAIKMSKNLLGENPWSILGKPIKTMIFIHAKDDYFYSGGLFSFDPNWYVSISDGNDQLYPTTNVDLIANYISEGYALSHWGYSWGLGEDPAVALSYSNFWGKAVEYYATGKTIWSMGAEIYKYKYGALRYFDQPMKDCDTFSKPGTNCSVDHYKYFKDTPDMPARFGVGVPNKALYLLATSAGWDTKKAFEVLIQATNYFHWDGDWDSGEFPPDWDFNFLGCKMLDAANDYGYETESIKTAFNQVGIEIKDCDKV